MSSPIPHPILLGRPQGLQAELLTHGALRRLLAPGLMVNLFPGNELEGGPANLWLRRRDAQGRVQLAPLLGPGSPLAPCVGSQDGDSFAMRGRWQDLALTLELRLVPEQTTAFWHLSARNEGGTPCTLNLLLLQDLGLADYGALRLNEYYVSHYLDLQPLTHERLGVLLAVRQNQAQRGRHPWLLAGSLRRCVRWATDAAQVFGHAAHEGLLPAALLEGLPGRRLQHEHAMAALEDQDLVLAAGAQGRTGFVLHLEAHHPQASDATDLERLAALLALPQAVATLAAGPADGTPAPRPARESASLFATAPLLATRELQPDEIEQFFPGPRRHEERETRDGQGQPGRLLSFFHAEDAHVVLRAKELRVQRPHGHLLRSGAHLVPDERALTSTCWMGGVFHSMLTQGHVSFNRLLSAQHSLLGLFRSQGLRLFMQAPGGEWQLLGLPSAFEMRPQSCRWLYAHAGGLIEVRAEAPDAPERMDLRVRVLAGPVARLRATLHLALGGDDGSQPAPVPLQWQPDGSLRLAPPPGSELARRFPDGAFRLVLPQGGQAQAGDDGRLYPDGRSRGEPLLCLDFERVQELALQLRGELLDAAPPAQATGLDELDSLTLPSWQPPPGADGQRLAQLADILPWYRHNALVHYLSPRGLEQYSGGGWGTRDVCQGPLEMLLALGRTEPVRDLLCRVFSAQDGSGDWPQWFMFFERERAIRAGDSHGDIVFWPLLALAQYLIASGDAGLLDQALPFHDDAPATVWTHVERALALIRARCVPGTRLAAYWHGDWNDSLQPADPALRERLCSAWTVTLHHQMLLRLAEALAGLGREEEARQLQVEAAEVNAAFQAHLVRDDVVAGYLHRAEDGAEQLWLHPRDTLTGLRYSLLPMMHAVLENLLSPEQADTQAALIERHLKGPDGARLFDAPLPYRGGPTRLFQRAETSSFFGREIGVMYMHAHLRYAQMLAHLGRAEAFFEALAQAHPVALPDRLACASRRQANCYYSSSDAAFPDRYEAQQRYAEVLEGRVLLDGGWRVYSSGPGIALGLVISGLLGLRLERDALVLDPVMPASLDGLRVRLTLGGLDLALHYRVGPRGHGVNEVRDAQGPLAFERLRHRYRLGAVALPRPAPGQTLHWEVRLG